MFLCPQFLARVNNMPCGVIDLGSNIYAPTFCVMSNDLQQAMF